MGKIGCGYGSEWHLLRYLGYHRDDLGEKIQQKTGKGVISWIDFGFHKTDNLMKFDKELVGLAFIKDQEVRNKWKAFWPAHGNSQNWDALGTIDYDDHKEWLLVEAKAHIGEIKSSCDAKNAKSLVKINNALKRTTTSFCVDPPTMKTWLEDNYQYANRLAALHFMMKECQPAIPARLLFIYFYGDKRDDATCPQNEQDWVHILDEIEESMGINRRSELYQRVHRLCLPVNPRIC
jgi:hypothetical protein